MIVSRAVRQGSRGAVILASGNLPIVLQRYFMSELAYQASNDNTPERVVNPAVREAAATGEPLDKHQLLERIASEVGVPLHDVEMMEGRLSGSDYSLNATQSTEDEGREWIDALPDDAPQAEHVVAHREDTAKLRGWLADAMANLSDRERLIVRERKLRDEVRTLESLGEELGLSKERVRQLESAAFGKMRKSLESCNAELHDLLA